MGKVNHYLLLVFLCIGILLTACEKETDIKDNRSYDMQAVLDRGEIVDFDGKVQNIEKLDDFIKKWKNAERALVKVVSYTLEGDPVVKELITEKGQIAYKVDVSRDQYAGNRENKVEVYQCQNIGIQVGKNERGENRLYYLEHCEGAQKVSVVRVWN